MSSYLIARITTATNIAVRYRTKVVAAHGTRHLEALTLADTETGAPRRFRPAGSSSSLAPPRGPTRLGPMSSATRRDSW